ncbi:MAG: hypothetical protein R2820_06830 [Cyclobacteriaceae bacterium]|nr:hypothetical protein [Cyclobacteriaceae bacterium]
MVRRGKSQRGVRLLSLSIASILSFVIFFANANNSPTDDFRTISKPVGQSVSFVRSLKIKPVSVNKAAVTHQVILEVAFRDQICFLKEVKTFSVKDKSFYINTTINAP